MTDEAAKQDHKCPVCSSDIKEARDYDESGTSMYRYSCPRCGDFHLEYSLSHKLPYILNNNLRQIGVLSHWIRRKHESIQPDELGHTEMILLNESLVDSIIKSPLPSPAEQAAMFVLWLGNKTETSAAHGDKLFVQPCTHQAIMGATTADEFEWVLWHLFDTGIVQGERAAAMEAPGRAFVTLSFEGWEYFQELKRGARSSRKAFMAMEYSDGALDKIVEDVFKPAVQETGFDLVRLDDSQPAGLIDDRLRVEIQTSRFMIADLTHENRGAYWEAGYAEGLGKPVIYTCEKKKFDELKTHFDTNHHLTIPWDASNPQKAAEKLKATIRVTLPDQAKLSDD